MDGARHAASLLARWSFAKDKWVTRRLAMKTARVAPPDREEARARRMRRAAREINPIDGEILSDSPLDAALFLQPPRSSPTFAADLRRRSRQAFRA
jgi:hypothetical protein